MCKEEILRILKSYAYGEIRLQEFEDWVLSHLQAILHCGDMESETLINEADSLLIELGADVIEEEALLDWARGIVSSAETLEQSVTIGNLPEITFSETEVSQSGSSTELFEAPALSLVFG